MDMINSKGYNGMPAAAPECAAHLKTHIHLKAKEEQKAIGFFDHHCFSLWPTRCPGLKALRGHQSHCRWYDDITASYHLHQVGMERGEFVFLNIHWRQRGHY